MAAEYGTVVLRRAWLLHTHGEVPQPVNERQPLRCLELVFSTESAATPRVALRRGPVRRLEASTRSQVGPGDALQH